MMNSSRRIWSIASLAMLLLISAGCGKPPQIGSDEAVFGEVDALYTAVTSKRSDLLEDSLSRLQALYEEGKLPDPAFQKLTLIAEQAQREEWRPAAEKLWHFMRGQRKST